MSVLLNIGMSFCISILEYCDKNAMFEQRLMVMLGRDLSLKSHPKD